jgi:PST family polysaccharide transporter
MNRHQSKSSVPERHIRLDAVHSNLSKLSIHSSFIRIAGQGIQLILIISSGMVLARLLTPADFGLFVLVHSFILLVNTFQNFGLRMATVLQEDLNHQQISAIFWLNLKLNIWLLLFMILMAPVIAWFYSDARLIGITLILAIATFGLSLSTQHESLLIRQMRFGRLTFIELGSITSGIAVAITLGILNFGYWALVYQLLVSNLTKSVLTWLLCGWYPTRLSAFTSNPDICSLVSYGGHYTGFKVLTHLSNKLDVILLGYVSGPTGVGLYQNAFRWAFFLIQQLYDSLLSVIVSGLSRRKNNAVAYRAAFKKGLLPILSVILPILLFMFVEAHSVILLLLGDQWLEAVPLFRLLSLAAFVTGISSVITSWLYLSQGETKRQFQWSLFSSPFIVLALAIGVQWGAYGIAAGFMIAKCLLMFPEIAFCLSRSHISGRDFLSIVWRPVVASITAAAFVGLLLESDVSMIELLEKLLFFGIVYSLFWIILPGGRQAIKDVWQLLVVLQKKDTNK